ncbi:MAG: GPP34 family phosphoprotein [Pseudomonadota bacterium]
MSPETAKPTLTFAEEVMLLVLDDETGRIAPIGSYALNLTLAGAVLMDLAQRARIDADEDKIAVIDRSPTGEEILDPTLAQLAESPEPHDARYWVEEISGAGEEIKEKALEHLVRRGILQVVDQKILWVFETRRYPMVDCKEEQEVRERILEVVLGEMTPGPRDVVLICLADACSIFESILSPDQLERVAGRIAEIRHLNLIGEAVASAVEQLRLQIALAIARAP